MDTHVDEHNASASTEAPTDADHIGRPNADGLFYAACSQRYGEDICGCPLCQQAAALRCL